MPLSLSTLTPTPYKNKNGWRAVINLLLLSTLSSGLLITDDFIQQLFISTNHAELEWNFVAAVWLFSLALWLCHWPRLSTTLLSAFALMELVQLGHISFFGEPLSAIGLKGLFDDFAEVRQTGVHSFFDHWHVLPSVLVPYGLLITLHLLLPHRIALPRNRWALLIIILVLGGKPYRASYRGFQAFTPGPTRSALHNSFNAFSYYAVRLALRDETTIEASFKPYQLTPQASQTHHLWLVIPDSLRTDHLNLFGYERDTMPRLNTLAQRGQLIAKPGIASGVSTLVSLSNLINLVSSPGQTQLLTQQPYNLFSIAKANGFNTLWLSSQESKLLAYLGKRAIDTAITRETHPLLFAQKHDFALVDLLAQQAWPARHFAVINLRSAHLPYAENYSQYPQPLPWNDQLPDRKERQINAYDNSLRYLDDVLSEIINAFERLDGERYLIITGDHGQLLGEQESWGHNVLKPEVIEVPVLIVARNAPESALEEIRTKRWVSHYEIATWIAARLGTRVENPNWHEGRHFVQGTLPFGDTPLREVETTPTGLTYKPAQLLSQWLRETEAKSVTPSPARTQQP
ncbi:MAG: sulfatase-like hydrolase/transferase [Pseudomonas sp.]